MAEETTLEAYSNTEELITHIAEAFDDTVKDLLLTQDSVHIVLTGGTVGIALLSALDLNGSLDWTRIHLWWGDERFVPQGDPQRNEGQAAPGLLDRVGIPQKNIHRMPASDTGMSVVEAATAYSNDLSEFFGDNTPRFDITFLGVGPDAHVASLFPGREAITVTGTNVVAVNDSPKPPAERISLTLEALNSSDRIWIVAAGADKADAVYSAFTQTDKNLSPVSAVDGVHETVFFTDEAAASRLLED
jgi:6-phosphogluconolactonase